jgi:SAM-dependent methyltransferase
MQILATIDLEEIANQCSCPKGELGIGMGEKMNDSNIEMTLQTINNLSLDKDDQVLELGHGNGGHLQSLINHVNDLQYFGFEISLTMANQARLTNANLVHEKQASFELYDGTFIPFQEQFFQNIFTVNTIYFWKKPKTLLVEIYRVLRPGGTFIITFAKKEFMEKLPFVQFGFRLWEVSEVIELAKSIGFEHLESIDLEDEVESKSGEIVNRKYIVMKFGK